MQTTATHRQSEQERQEPRPVIAGPDSGHMLRPFTLSDAKGQQIRLWDYRQRNNLVLFFHHGAGCPACRNMLQELAAHMATYYAEKAIVLAIGPDQPHEARQFAAELECPFPLLSDPSGRVAAQQGLAVPAVVVADRFNEIWAAWPRADNHVLPRGEEIAAWLAFMEIQCPECDPLAWRSLE